MIAWIYTLNEVLCRNLPERINLLCYMRVPRARQEAAVFLPWRSSATRSVSPGSWERAMGTMMMPFFWGPHVSSHLLWAALQAPRCPASYSWSGLWPSNFTAWPQTCLVIESLSGDPGSWVTDPKVQTCPAHLLVYSPSSSEATAWLAPMIPLLLQSFSV